MTSGIVLFLLLAPAPQDSRTAQIEKERDEKAARLKPEVLPPAEKTLRRMQDEKVIEKFTEGYKGFRLKAGGLATGGGFALGPEWHNESGLGGQLHVSASAQLSTRLWQKYNLMLGFPHLFGQRLAAGVSSTYRNYSSLDYYGNGMHTSREGRTNYRLEDTDVLGTAVLRPQRRMRMGFGGGYLFTNVGPGKRSGITSTDAVYTDATAPGIQTQTNFGRYGFFGQYDYRDNPSGPKTGGNYVVQTTWYKDLSSSSSLYSFRRFDVDVQQYIGFFNNLRRIALRARGTFTEVEQPGRTVPFYLRPTIGGSDDLRGYRTYRFSDRNALVLNGEYRWEVFSGLDGALFFDAAKVMPHAGHLALGQMKTSAGFGLRGNVRNATFLRFDVGFSQEGFMIWFKFNDAFNSQRYSTGAVQPVY